MGRKFIKKTTAALATLCAVSLSSFGNDNILPTRTKNPIDDPDVSNGSPNDVWISSDRNDGKGSGTQLDPYDGSTHTKLDTIFADGSKTTNNSTVHLIGDAVFSTSGLTIPNQNFTLLGADSGATTVELINKAATFVGTVISSAAGGSHVLVKNLTVDCNLQGQTGSNCVIGAVALAGEYCGIDHVHAKNWGNTGTGQECFVVSIEHHPGTAITTALGNKIAYCMVDTPAPVVHGSGGTTAIDIFGQGQSGSGLTKVGNGWMIGPEIAFNTVHDVSTGSTNGKPQIFHAYTLGTSDSADVHNNWAYNLTSGGVDPYKDDTSFYLDTWSVRRLAIHDNNFIDVAKGIFVNRLGSSYQADKWKVSNNRIVLNSSSGGTYDIYARGSANVTGWSVTNNTVETSYRRPLDSLPSDAWTSGNHKSDGTLLR